MGQEIGFFSPWSNKILESEAEVCILTYQVLAFEPSQFCYFGFTVILVSNEVSYVMTRT